MMSIYPLNNQKKTYAWGSRTAIAELLGETSPSREPEAELWMGAHPGAASAVTIGAEEKGLDAWLRELGEAWLGAEVYAAYGGRLPFLLKVLAAEQPLSIQAHPDPAQAMEGFERENAAGIGLDAAERNYKDRSHKPEILHALTPFVILRGWREPAAILDLFRRAELDALLPELSVLEQGPEGLRPFFRSFLDLEEDRLHPLLEQLLCHRERLPAAEREWVGRLAETFPGDRGILAPLFLRLMRLEPGSAVFTGAGVLHAYLDGVGVELMANSDNVLRGGCTEKHVDPEELMRVVHFEVGDSGLVEPRRSDGLWHFPTPADEFRLDRLEVRPGAPLRSSAPTLDSRTGAPVTGPRILLCVEGGGTLRPAAVDPASVDPASVDPAAADPGAADPGGLASSEAVFPFSRGASFLVPASVPSLEIEGEAVLFRASVARCSGG